MDGNEDDDGQLQAVAGATSARPRRCALDGSRPSDLCEPNEQRASPIAEPRKRRGFPATLSRTPGIAESTNRAQLGVFAVFAAHALVFSSWVPHISHVKSDLGLSDGELGDALLGAPLGALLATVLCVWVLPRWGSHRLVPVTVAGYAASGPLLGLAGSELELFLALTCVGFFLGGLDVAMNVQAGAVERLAASPIMSRFHGLRSVAVLLGALIGAACVSADVGLAAQLTVVGTIVVVVVLPLSRGLPRDAAPSVGKRTERPGHIWKSPTVMILSAVAFASFLCEGSASDWSGDYLGRVVGAAPAVAALSYVPFTLVMAATRLGGPRLYKYASIRWLLPTLALFAAAGLCVTLVTANLTATFVGFAALGAGVALLVPAAMTAAYSPSDAGTAIALVAAIGWVGYLIGPPLIGQLAQRAGLTVALITVPVMMTLVAIAIRFTHAFDAADAFPADKVNHERGEPN
ncbi:MFS transporter [Mycolicibacter sp. MYC123]|uniref:MFS transporter n=1 Tax=[Mycobacterium] zoologicum TaxID=2872311 RepID=A0ABU5YIJ9_9MYCO|nr:MULTISPECIES: MFS transporter [unclassified Mycolicibacter]MEB3049880.1 MFS transporter [Mycolicibacter sp. MYC123]MEB3062259.1 MFS transporter [Mycolicibacter sp. MYC101]